MTRHEIYSIIGSGLSVGAEIQAESLLDIYAKLFHCRKEQTNTKKYAMIIEL